MKCKAWKFVGNLGLFTHPESNPPHMVIAVEKIWQRGHRAHYLELFKKAGYKSNKQCSLSPLKSAVPLHCGKVVCSWVDWAMNAGNQCQEHKLTAVFSKAWNSEPVLGSSDKGICWREMISLVTITEASVLSCSWILHTHTKSTRIYNIKPMLIQCCRMGSLGQML